MRSIILSLLISLLLSLGLLCKEDPGKQKTVQADEDQYQVAFLIMDGVYNTELTAPFDIFQHTIFRDSIKPMRVFTVANTSEPIKTFEGLRIIPDYNYLEDNYPAIDILVVPSAEHHPDSDLQDGEMIDFVRRTSESSEYIISLCDGAFVLAKAGLLDSVTSTTFPGDLDKYSEMFPHLNVDRGSMVVHDGKFITSAGGARSFDAALYLCEYLYGKEIADRLARGLVIDWDSQTAGINVVQ